MPRGARLKLTPEIIEAAVELKLAHLPIHRIADALGICEATWHRWLAVGKQSKVGIQREFLEAIKRAEAEQQRRLLATIEAASVKSWQAAAWLLERQYPRDYALTNKLEHSGGGENASPLRIVVEYPEDAPDADSQTESGSTEALSRQPRG